jgi:hypothetical protein
MAEAACLAQPPLPGTLRPPGVHRVLDCTPCGAADVEL